MMPTFYCYPLIPRKTNLEPRLDNFGVGVRVPAVQLKHKLVPPRSSGQNDMIHGVLSSGGGGRCPRWLVRGR